METTAKKKHRRAGRVLLWIAGGLLSVAAAVLIHYRGVHPVLNLEYGTGAPKAADFTQREAVLETDGERLSIGWHVLDLKIGGVPTPVLVKVQDTVAPTATAVDRLVPVGTALGPDAFIRNLRDADIVQLTFAETPDFEHESEQDTVIVMKDGSENESTVTAHITVRATLPSITLEAGSDVPTVDAFLLEGIAGTLDEPIAQDCMHHDGVTPVGITTTTGIKSVSLLIVKDTVAPQAEGTTLLLSPGETVLPEDFVAKASDETTFTYAYVNAPDYDSRVVQNITVRLTDEGGNATDVAATLLISGVHPKTVEARKEPLNDLDFQNDEGDTIEVPAFIPDVPGTYSIDVLTNGIEQTLAVTVVDTTAPVMKEKTLSAKLYTKHPLTPEDLYSATDLSGVTLSFTEQPDWEKAGEQTVSVSAEDPYGNKTVMERKIKLLSDTKSPQIYGVINRMCYVNETIAYKQEVFAEDDIDGRIEVTVESEVVPNKKGTYKVVYRAKDLSGNEATQSCTFTLIDRTVTEEQVREMAQKVLKQILKPGMVDAEKLKAIFDYVQKHLKYTNGVNNNYTDWRKAAMDGYTRGTGDCYNIYSLTRALLDETGIQYLSVERVKAYPWRTRHFWVHVNIGTGWYVFDPTWTPRHRYNCFMWTKSQCNSCRNYWKYDESKYPPLATEPFDYNAVVAMQKKAQK